MTRKTTPYARKRAAGHGLRPRDGITTSRTYTTRLKPGEVATILEPCHRALQALSTVSATHHQWVVLCTAGHVAEAIEDGRIIRGQREIIDAANAALAAIGERCGLTATQWHPGPCHNPEITALADLVAAYSRQVRELTYAEYNAAVDRAVARVASVGGQVFRMGEETTT